MDPLVSMVCPSTTKILTRGQRRGSLGISKFSAAVIHDLDELLIFIFQWLPSWTSKSSSMAMAPLSARETLNQLSTQVHKQSVSAPARKPSCLQCCRLSATIASTGIQLRKPAVLLPVSPPTDLPSITTCDLPHLRTACGHIWCLTKQAG